MLARMLAAPLALSLAVAAPPSGATERGASATPREQAVARSYDGRRTATPAFAILRLTVRPARRGKQTGQKEVRGVSLSI